MKKETKGAQKKGEMKEEEKGQQKGEMKEPEKLTKE
jgi:hypothetical protein